MKPFHAAPRSVVIAVVVAMTLSWGAATAAAQDDDVVPSDVTTGYDHVNSPPPGALSSVTWCFAFDDPSLPGRTIEITATGPSGTVTGEGVVTDVGSAVVRVGITEGGTYAITSIRVRGGGGVVLPEQVREVTVVFEPLLVDCLESLVFGTVGPTVTPVPQPTPTPQPTATPEPTATAAPTTPPDATTEPEATAAPTSPPTTGDDPDPDDGGSNLPWILVGIGGVTIAGGGLFLLAKKPGKPCDEEKRAWDAAERSFQDALDGVEEAEKTMTDAAEARKKAASELAKATRDVPPEPGGDSVTDERTGETITSRDRWLRDRYAAAEWDAYQSNPNPETARAYEEAMRSADTPEAREARREAGETARGKAQQLEAALETARQTEREAEAALGRRQRDVKSERELADAAKKRYEECIRQQAEFDREAAQSRKRYEDALERDRERRSGGGDGGAGGGTAITTPPPVEISGPCEPIGSTDTATTRVHGPAIGDNDTVTITVSRSHGTWENDELAAESEDPFLSMFGPGRGAGQRAATFTRPAQWVAGMQPGALIAAFERRQQQLQNDFDATASRRLTVTFTWHQQHVDATCTKQVRCTGSGWLSTGPGRFDNSSRPMPDGAPVSIEFGDHDPAAELARLRRTLANLIAKRDELFELMETCATP